MSFLKFLLSLLILCLISLPAHAQDQKRSCHFHTDRSAHHLVKRSRVYRRPCLFPGFFPQSIFFLQRKQPTFLMCTFSLVHWLLLKSDQMYYRYFLFSVWWYVRMPADRQGPGCPVHRVYDGFWLLLHTGGWFPHWVLLCPAIFTIAYIFLKIEVWVFPLVF